MNRLNVFNLDLSQVKQFGMGYPGHMVLNFIEKLLNYFPQCQ